MIRYEIVKLCFAADYTHNIYTLSNYIRRFGSRPISGSTTILLLYNKNNMLGRTPVPRRPRLEPSIYATGTPKNRGRNRNIPVRPRAWRPDERPVSRPALSTKTLPVPVAAAVHFIFERSRDETPFVFALQTPILSSRCRSAVHRPLVHVHVHDNITLYIIRKSRFYRTRDVTIPTCPVPTTQLSSCKCRKVLEVYIPGRLHDISRGFGTR